MAAPVLPNTDPVPRIDPVTPKKEPGFYKVDPGGEVLYGENDVLGPEYSLTKNEHKNYTYPVDGWYWFKTRKEAYTFFNLVEPTL